jgi:FUN14 domain-containing protein 1
VERYVDRKLDKAEDVLKRKERRTRHWYHTFVSDEKLCQLKKIHIFLVAFAAGVAIGIASGH